MSGGGQTQTKVENKDPWAPAQPYLTDMMSKGAGLYNSGAGSQTWGGPLSAGTPQDLQSGYDQARSFTPINPMGGAAYGTMNNIATAGPTSSSQNLAGMASGADAGNNPYLLKMLQDNDARIGNRVASQMSGAGRYGSFGHGDALARSITAANAPILSAAYEGDRNRMLQASGQIDSSNRASDAARFAGASGMLGAQQNYDAMRSSNVDRMLGIGGMQQAQEQADIERQRALFEQQQQMPWTQLQRYMQSVTGTAPLTANAGTTTGSSNTQKDLGLMDYASLFSGGDKSAASGGANILGALMMSDRNEKTDIKKVGEHPTGLPIYAYRYKDDPKTYPKVVGPMAQDIEAMMPGSTVRIGGKLAVKREALGILGL